MKRRPTVLGALLLLFVQLFWLAPGASAATSPLALESAVSVPIDVSADGEWLLLFLPGLQGFEIVNTRSGERDIVSDTPCTGYFATISPDKKYVCFKDFSQVGDRKFQVPTLYDIAQKKLLPLSDPVPTAGNPVVSSHGLIAYTLGEQLVVLNPDFSPVGQHDLGVAANVLTFSPNGKRLAYSDENETVSWIDVGTGLHGAVPTGWLRGYQPRFSPDGQSLLVRNSQGEISACHLITGRAKNFGRTPSAAWVDNDTVAFVQKDTANFAVTETRVVHGKISSGAITKVMTKKGDAAFALNASIMAFTADEGISMADARTGDLKKATIQSRTFKPVPELSEAAAKSSEVSAQGVTTNGTTVELTGVPYINQVYDTDPSFPGGGSCCNAVASLIAIQYYGRLPTHPITCTQGGTHTSNYGYYVTSIYSYNGHIFDAVSADWDLEGWYGGFGYFLQDAGGSSSQHSTRLKEFITDHGLTSALDDSPTMAEARTEINANHPIVVLNDLTSAGHYITCIGYISGQNTLIFNDPYGNKNVAYPSKAGAGATYDWPGYNNGYMNLNGVPRYVYARGTAWTNTSFGSYWDRNGSTTGAGTSLTATWDSSSTNWSSSSAGSVITGPWAEQNAYFSAGSDATNTYTVTISGAQVVNNLMVQDGTVTFTGGQLYFRGTGTYYSNYVAAGLTATFNTPFYGTGSPDKWGPGTAVYNGASTSTGYYSLNEGTLGLGNNAALGTGDFHLGNTSGANVVAIQSANASAYTLANKVVFLAHNFNIGAGGNLTFTGPVDVGSSSSTIGVSNTMTTFSGVLTNSGGLGKIGPGTLVLSGAGANAYGGASGNTTVSGGTLKLAKTAGVAAVANGTLIANAGGTLLLGAANQIGDAVPMTLSGGIFQAAGFSEQLGTLKLTANSLLDLGSGASVLTFAASSGVAWTAGTTLTVTNWNGSIGGGGSERVVFGSAGSALTLTQVGQIRFANPTGFPAGSYAAAILSTGEVMPATAAPGITSQPQNKFTAAGDSITLTCAATGTPTPAWQWRCGGTNLAGATSSVLTILNVAMSQAGSYSVVVSNLAGTVTSSPAMVSVYPTAAPTMTGAGNMTQGEFQLSLSGVPGYKYAILVSSNLDTWTPLQTNVAPFNFTDTNCPAFTRRFYRTQYIP